MKLKIAIDRQSVYYQLAAINQLSTCIIKLEAFCIDDIKLTFQKREVRRLVLLILSTFKDGWALFSCMECIDFHRTGCIKKKIQTFSENTHGFVDNDDPHGTTRSIYLRSFHPAFPGCPSQCRFLWLTSSAYEVEALTIRSPKICEAVTPYPYYYCSSAPRIVIDRHLASSASGSDSSTVVAAIHPSRHYSCLGGENKIDMPIIALLF